MGIKIGESRDIRAVSISSGLNFVNIFFRGLILVLSYSKYHCKLDL